jgi:hypothetical protein
MLPPERRQRLQAHLHGAGTARIASVSIAAVHALTTVAS